jgi:hypothetical protein
VSHFTGLIIMFEFDILRIPSVFTQICSECIASTYTANGNMAGAQTNPLASLTYTLS